MVEHCSATASQKPQCARVTRLASKRKRVSNLGTQVGVCCRPSGTNMQFFTQLKHAASIAVTKLYLTCGRGPASTSSKAPQQAATGQPLSCKQAKTLGHCLSKFHTEHVAVMQLTQRLHTASFQMQLTWPMGGNPVAVS